MNTWWYINRSAGLVAWILLAGSIILGLMLSTKAAGKKVRPNWIQDLHRGLSGLAVAFVGVHIAGAVADNYVHFGWADVLVPFASHWKSLPIAWGVVTLYLLIAVEATSLARKHLSKSLWRRVHFLSFPLFISATLHGVTSGSDIRNTAAIATISMLTASIMGLTVYRVLDAMEAKNNPAPPRVPTRAGAGAPGGSGAREAALAARAARAAQVDDPAAPGAAPAAETRPRYASDIPLAPRTASPQPAAFSSRPTRMPLPDHPPTEGPRNAARGMPRPVPVPTTPPGPRATPRPSEDDAGWPKPPVRSF